MHLTIHWARSRSHCLINIIDYKAVRVDVSCCIVTTAVGVVDHLLPADRANDTRYAAFSAINVERHCHRRCVEWVADDLFLV